MGSLVSSQTRSAFSLVIFLFATMYSRAAVTRGVLSNGQSSNKEWQHPSGSLNAWLSWSEKIKSVFDSSGRCFLMVYRWLRLCNRTEELFVVIKNILQLTEHLPTHMTDMGLRLIWFRIVWRLHLKLQPLWPYWLSLPNFDYFWPSTLSVILTVSFEPYPNSYQVFSMGK